MPNDAARRVHGLDSLRGLAAVGVALHHIPLFAQVETGPWLRFVKDYLHLGVPLFFCISAYTMYHVYADATYQRAFEQRFLVKRYARLLPMYAVSFALLYGLANAVYGVRVPHGPLELFVLFALLFSIVPSLTVGGAPASWSIGVEMMFYVIFPVMVRLFRTPLALGAGLLVSLAVSYAFQASVGRIAGLPPLYHAINPVLYGPCFFLGALLWSIVGRRHERAHEGLAASAAILALLYAFHVFSQWKARLGFGDVAVSYWLTIQVAALVFTAIIYSQLRSRPQLFENAITRYLGRLSYSIYLLHFIVIQFAVRPLVPTIKRLLGEEPTMVFVACGVVLMAVVLPLAELAYRFVEAPGIRLGGRIARWIDARHAAEGVAEARRETSSFAVPPGAPPAARSVGTPEPGAQR